MILFVQSIAAYFAIYGFSLILEAPEKYLSYAGFAGGACWFVYLAVSMAGF